MSSKSPSHSAEHIAVCPPHHVPSRPRSLRRIPCPCDRVASSPPLWRFRWSSACISGRRCRPTRRTGDRRSSRLRASRSSTQTLARPGRPKRSRSRRQRSAGRPQKTPQSTSRAVLTRHVERARALSRWVRRRKVMRSRRAPLGCRCWTGLPVMPWSALVWCRSSRPHQGPSCPSRWTTPGSRRPQAATTPGGCDSSRSRNVPSRHRNSRNAKSRPIWARSTTWVPGSSPRRSPCRGLRSRRSTSPTRQRPLPAPMTRSSLRPQRPL